MWSFQKAMLTLWKVLSGPITYTPVDGSSKKPRLLTSVLICMMTAEMTTNGPSPAMKVNVASQNVPLSQTTSSAITLNPNAPVFTPRPSPQWNPKPHTDQLSIMHFNARSLLPKISELSNVANNLSPHIIAISETWLSSSVSTKSVTIPGYTQGIRTDRQNDRRGGGTMILARDDVFIKERTDLRYWDESTWAEVSIKSSSGKKHSSVIIACLYRPPTADTIQFGDAIETALNKLSTSHPVILTGDFNATSPLWSQQDTYNRAGIILEPLFLSLGLKQHVSEPTHLLHDHSPGNLLDLVLTNSPVKLSNLSLHSPIGKSDHLVVFFTVSLSIVRQTNKVMKRIWCYDKANISALNSELKEHDWSFVDSAESVDDAWDSWKSSFLEIISKHVPSKKLKRTTPKLPWITQHVETEIKKKHSLFRVYKRTGLLTERKAFVAQRNLVTRLLRKAEKQYSTSLFRDRSTRSSSASNTFWSYVRSTMGKSQVSSIPDLVNDAGATLRGDDQKACALNSFFTAQTNLKLKDSDPDLTDLPKNSKSFMSLYATSTEIYDILRSLPRRKAPGPDTITTDLLRICAPGIASSLSVLINRSFRDAVFPSGWKLAYVSPVFKKGNPSLLTNYRPIALLSAVGKVCERLVYNKLYRFVTPVLSENQSGFRKKDGTAFQLTRLMQEWSLGRLPLYWCAIL